MQCYSIPGTSFDTAGVEKHSIINPLWQPPALCIQINFSLTILPRVRELWSCRLVPVRQLCRCAAAVDQAMKLATNTDGAKKVVSKLAIGDIKN